MLSTVHLRHIQPKLYIDKLATTGASLFIVSKSYVPMKCCVYIYLYTVKRSNIADAGFVFMKDIESMA